MSSSSQYRIDSSIADCSDQQQHSGKQGEIGQACRQECLRCSNRRTRSLKPETDERIGTEADQFPRQEQGDEVGSKHEREHGACEEAEFGEETTTTRVGSHVADSVDEDHQPNNGYQGSHERTKRIEPERESQVASTNSQPGERDKSMHPKSRSKECETGDDACPDH